MLQIRCTAKALKQFDIPAIDTCQVRPSDTVLGDWYCNLLTIDRRKCLLFMSERTFLSFLLFGVRKDNSKSIPQVFANGLDQLLRIEGFDENQINNVFRGYQICELTKTDSRSALGNMRDLMLNYEHAILYNGGLKTCDVGEIIHKMNRMPQKNIEWKYSIDVVKEMLGAGRKR